MLLSLLKISGHSMEPTIKNGSIVAVSSVPYCIREPKVGDVILFLHRRKKLIKRIKEIKNGRILVEGDNKEDTSNVGWISKDELLGKILIY